MDETSVFQRAKLLFDQALELSSDQRLSFLKNACGQDISLYQEVLSLLQSYKEAGDFLNDDHDTWEDEDAEDVGIGDLIGPYQIIQRLGQGGMSTVYLAQRTKDYTQEVAIKLIKSGIVTRFFVRKFELERDILGKLDHQNIARISDGGRTTSGLPYFAMEYIKGEPITDYCDRKKLNITERLHLFIKVCNGVQYCHQKLIVHRDIKPSNILVTEEGIPKILDFGIAKLLAPESMGVQAEPPTDPYMRMMTLEYASPEQIEDKDITTASDVYSLGVVLYELLTGWRPYGEANLKPYEISSAIIGDSPLRPSSVIGKFGETTDLNPQKVSDSREGKPQRLRKRLQGDMDTIVLKALRKKSEERYPTAERLSEDIIRHLESRPVLAQPDSLVYRTRKFVQRNLTAITAVTLIILSLLGGMVATLRERDRISTLFEGVRNLATQFLDLDSDIAALPGSTAARSRLVQSTLKYLDTVAAQSEGNLPLERELANAYQKVGDIQGNPSLANLGLPQAAQQSYQRALTIRERLQGFMPQDLQLRLDIAANHDRLGIVYRELGDTHTAEQKYLLTLNLLQNLPITTQRQAQLATTYTNIGIIKLSQGQIDAALSYEQEGLELNLARNQATPKDFMIEADLLRSYIRLGDVYNPSMVNTFGDSNQARGLYQKSLSLAQMMVKRDPQDPRWQRLLSTSYLKVGDIFHLTPATRPKALNYFQSSLIITKRSMESDGQDILIQGDLARIYERIGFSEFGLNHFEKSRQAYQQAITLWEMLVKKDLTNIRVQRDRTSRYLDIAKTYLTTAQNPASPIQQRRADAQMGLFWYKKTYLAVDALRSQGKSNADDLARLTQAGQSIAMCNRLLSQLPLRK